MKRTEGVDRNHNHTLKAILKGAATLSSGCGTGAAESSLYESHGVMRLRAQLHSGEWLAQAEIGQDFGRRAGAGIQLLEHIFPYPVVNVKRVEKVTGLFQPAANASTKAMQEIGVLREMTGKKPHRVCGFDRSLQLFQEREVRG